MHIDSVGISICFLFLLPTSGYTSNQPRLSLFVSSSCCHSLLSSVHVRVLFGRNPPAARVSPSRYVVRRSGRRRGRPPAIYIFSLRGNGCGLRATRVVTKRIWLETGMQIQSRFFLPPAQMHANPLACDSVHTLFSCIASVVVSLMPACIRLRRRRSEACDAVSVRSIVAWHHPVPFAGRREREKRP